MRNRGINIELTALLDVILIMFFILLVQSGSQVETARESAEEQAAAVAALEGELAALQDRADGLELRNRDLERYKLSGDLVQDHSYLIMISIQSRDEDQEIYVEGEEREPVGISLGEDPRYVANRLRATLKGQMTDRAEPAAFVVFSYDSELIYQSDYALIRRIMLEMQDDPNVYLIEQDTRIR